MKLKSQKLTEEKDNKNRKVSSYGTFTVPLSDMTVPQEFTIIHLVHSQ